MQIFLLTYRPLHTDMYAHKHTYIYTCTKTNWNIEINASAHVFTHLQQQVPPISQKYTLSYKDTHIQENTHTYTQYAYNYIYRFKNIYVYIFV